QLHRGASAVFTFAELDLPIVAAPMAGGPSTPELVAAVAEAGGAGFLAAGYKAPETVQEQIRELRQRRVSAFGVNLFVPGEPVHEPAAVEAYREELRGEAERYSVQLP